MPEGAAFSWSFSDIVIRRKGRLAFRYRVPGCSLLDQWPEAARSSPKAASARRSQDAPLRTSAFGVAPGCSCRWHHTVI